MSRIKEITVLLSLLFCLEGCFKHKRSGSGGEANNTSNSSSGSNNSSNSETQNLSELERELLANLASGMGGMGLIMQTPIATFNSDSNDVLIPTNLNLSIDQNSSGIFYQSKIVLNLSATNADQMFITNSNDCSGVGSYEPFASTKNWELTTANGKNDISVKFKNSSSGGESSCLSTSVEYKQIAIGGTIKYLGESNSVGLKINNEPITTFSQNGAFTFAKQLDLSENFNVTLENQPANQVCRIEGGVGTITTATPINSIKVVCSLSIQSLSKVDTLISTDEYTSINGVDPITLKLDEAADVLITAGAGKFSAANGSNMEHNLGVIIDGNVEGEGVGQTLNMGLGGSVPIILTKHLEAGTHKIELKSKRVSYLVDDSLKIEGSSDPVVLNATVLNSLSHFEEVIEHKSSQEEIINQIVPTVFGPTPISFTLQGKKNFLYYMDVTSSNSTGSNGNDFSIAVDNGINNYLVSNYGYRMYSDANFSAAMLIGRAENVVGNYKVRTYGRGVSAVSTKINSLPVRLGAIKFNEKSKMVRSYGLLHGTTTSTTFVNIPSLSSISLNLTEPGVRKVLITLSTPRIKSSGIGTRGVAAINVDGANVITASSVSENSDRGQSISLTTIVELGQGVHTIKGMWRSDTANETLNMYASSSSITALVLE